MASDDEVPVPSAGTNGHDVRVWLETTWRETGGPPRWLRQVIKAARARSAEQLAKHEVAIEAHIGPHWSHARYWIETPATQFMRALRGVWARVSGQSAGTMPGLPAESGDAARLELRQTWLLDAADQWAADWGRPGTWPTGPVAPAGTLRSVRMTVLLVRENSRTSEPHGWPATLTLFLVKTRQPGDRLSLVAAPCSAVMPVDPHFEGGLRAVEEYLRKTVQAAQTGDLALAWDLCPAGDMPLGSVEGGSASAAIALGALWLLKDRLPAGDLQTALYRIDAMAFHAHPVTAVINGAGRLYPVEFVRTKGSALVPQVNALRRGVCVHVADGQVVASAPPDPAQAAIQIERHPDMDHLVAWLAEHALHLTLAQQALLDVLMRSDEYAERPPMVDTGMLGTVQTDPVENLVQYLLHRWATWAQRGGQDDLHCHFVPLSLLPGQAELPENHGLECGPHKSLLEALNANDAKGLHAYKLQGPPGAGKSTLLQHHERRLCVQGLRQYMAGKPIAELPLFLAFKGLAVDRNGSGPLVPRLLAAVREHVQADYPRCQELHHHLAEPRAGGTRLRLLCDGLNELPVARAEDRPDHVADLLQALRAWSAGTPMLLSARTHFELRFNAGSQAPLLVAPVQVLPWENEHVRAYLGLRFPREAGEPAPEVPDDLPRRAAAHWEQLRKAPLALDLCRTPMNLAGQCDLLIAGVTRVSTERADLYRRWLWQRLRRELDKAHTDKERAASPFFDESMLTRSDRDDLREPAALKHDTMPPWPRGGQLLPALFAQGAAQWRAAGLAQPGVALQARGVVAVPWDGGQVGAGGPVLPRVAASLGDDHLRAQWLRAVDLLGLGRKERGQFSWSHQAWGEYLASVDLLACPATPDDIIRDLGVAIAAPALAREDKDELLAMRQQESERWAEPGVQAVLDSLRRDGLPVDIARFNLEKSDRERARWREDGWLVEHGCEHRLDLQRMGSSLCPTDHSGREEWWRDAWRWRVVVDGLTEHMRERFWKVLGDENTKRLDVMARLHLPPDGDLDEVLVLAVQGMQEPVAWLSALCEQGHLRAAARCAIAVRERVEGGTDWSSAWPRRDGLLDQLRRILLLRTVGAGSSVRDRVTEAGLIELMTTADATGEERRSAQWAGELARAFEGTGLDVRLRLESAMLLGQLGDNIRLDLVEIADPDIPGRKRKGLVLRQMLFVAIGDCGKSAWHRIGDKAGEPDERNEFSIELEAFSFARFPVTVAEWRAFIEGGGYDPDAPWWSAVGEAAVRWLRREGGLQRRPSTWGRPGFDNPGQACSGVSWFESAAFANWASPLYAYAAKDPSVRTRLPNEVEWEAAVRFAPGEAGRPRLRWPHPRDSDGLDGADALCFNHGPTRWNLPSPPGVFSRGFTPGTGISDAAGGQWEWCANSYAESAYETEAGQRQLLVQASDETERTLRGGGFNSSAAATRCRVGFRGRRGPDTDNEAYGLRLLSYRQL